MINITFACILLHLGKRSRNIASKPVEKFFSYFGVFFEKTIANFYH